MKNIIKFFKLNGGLIILLSTVTLVGSFPFFFIFFTTRGPEQEELLRHKEAVVKIANGEKQTLPDNFNIDRYHDIIKILRARNLITEEQAKKAHNVTVTVQTKVEPKK